MQENVGLSGHFLPRLLFRGAVSAFDGVGFAHVLARFGLAVPAAPLRVINLAVKVDPHHAFLRSSGRAIDRYKRFDLSDYSDCRSPPCRNRTCLQ